MPGVEIDRSTLWKKARQDKDGNIPDPKVAEKANLIVSLLTLASDHHSKSTGCKKHLMHEGRREETVYFLDPLPGNHVVDEEAKNMVNSAIKIYNSHIGKQGRKAPIWKTLPGTPKQPSSVECEYYVMRFMRDIIMDPSLEFENTFAKGKEQAPYPQAAIDEVMNKWAEFVCLHME
ncbi:unnamed protein product [Prunus brigantina]